MEVKVKYIDPEIKSNEELHLKHIKDSNHSTWIDVRASMIEINGEIFPWVPKVKPNTGEEYYEINYKKGSYIRIFLGFAMELPEGYEAIVGPRGGTFKNFGLIQTNSKGIVDTSFCGDNDQWFVPMYALKDGAIQKHDRVAQFRIQEKMSNVEFKIVDKLDNKDRGGHSSTGTK